VRRRWLCVFALTFGFTIVLLVGMSIREARITSGNTSQVRDGAFRDGLFQAKIDFQSGRKAHVISGRWNSNADRALFIAGYQQGYRELSEASSTLIKPSGAELAGYRDGTLDGAAHRLAAQPFQVNRTENYRNASHGYVGGNVDLEESKRDYRRAYSNGYQWGYYSQRVHEELKTVSEKASSF